MSERHIESAAFFLHNSLNDNFHTNLNETNKIGKCTRIHFKCTTEVRLSDTGHHVAAYICGIKCPGIPNPLTHYTITFSIHSKTTLVKLCFNSKGREPN